jgi:hypothetical protein
LYHDRLTVSDACASVGKVVDRSTRAATRLWLLLQK